MIKKNKKVNYFILFFISLALNNYQSSSFYKTLGSNSTIQFVNSNLNNNTEKNDMDNNKFDKNAFMGLLKNNNSVNRIENPTIGKNKK